VSAEALHLVLGRQDPGNVPICFRIKILFGVTLFPFVRLVTFLPLPLLSVPFFRLCMAYFTVF
jgi:hypothetical protein